MYSTSIKMTSFSPICNTIWKHLGWSYPVKFGESASNPYWFFMLTHWGQVTHICVGKLTIIGSDNGLSPGRRQAIIRTNAGILLIWTLVTNFSEILSEIHTFSFKKMHLNMSSGKCRPFCVGLNVLTSSSDTNYAQKNDHNCVITRIIISTRINITTIMILMIIPMMELVFKWGSNCKSRKKNVVN